MIIMRENIYNFEKEKKNGDDEEIKFWKERG